MDAAAVPLWSSRRAREALALLGLAGLIVVSAAIAAGAQGDLHVPVPAAKLRNPGGCGARSPTSDPGSTLPPWAGSSWR